MTSFSLLRTRLLTVLGTGALAAITPHCGGSAETYGGGGAGSGGKMGSGGVSAQGGTLNAGGASAGGANGGTVNSAGVAGFYIPPCPPASMQCRTFAEINQCNQSVVDAGVGVGGEGGAGGEGSDPGVPIHCPIVQSYTCFSGGTILSGPTLVDGSCCYMVQQFCGVGRPFSVEGRARTATTAERTDWVDEFPTASLAPALREELAAAWLRDALLEHASIAAFGRLSLELLALGAPSDLLRDTHRAALDEIRHAELCFGLYGRYAAAPKGPGPIDVGGALSAVSLQELAVRAVEEGCVGETLGALVVQEQHRAAVDPVVKRALSEIADDEARHAELSWRIVRWAIEQGGPRVFEAVESAFRTAIEQAAKNHELQPMARAGLGEHGRLDTAETSRAIERGIAEVVRPCAEALLSGFRA